MESIHGHDVMHMIADAKSTARFHTCSAENMTALELVDFLTERGKIEGGESAMQVDASKICQH